MHSSNFGTASAVHIEIANDLRASNDLPHSLPKSKPNPPTDPIIPSKSKMPLLTLVQHLIRNAEEEKELAFDFSNRIIAMNRTERASLVSLMTTECQAILKRPISGNRIAAMIEDRYMHELDEDDFKEWDDDFDNQVTVEQSVKERVLNALVAGDDLTGDRDEARDFLARLIDGSPRETWCVVLPVARMLMTKHGWADKLNVGVVIEHCLARCDAAMALRELPIVAGTDVEAEFLSGVVETHGGRLPDEHIPTKPKATS